MKELFTILYLFSLLLANNISNAQGEDFVGSSGIYLLGSADNPTNAAHLNKPFISGLVIRTKWKSIEPSPGNFDFSFIDSQITTAQSVGKNISVAILGQPHWLVDSLGATGYTYIDNNPFHPTFGDTLSHPLKYDSIVVWRYKMLIDTLAVKYADDMSIKYFHIYSGISNDLPRTVADGTPFYQAHFYDPDTLISRWKDLTIHYMSRFPNTPVWNSPDKIKFEMDATGLSQTYVPDSFMAWGASSYPDRFGVWREDLSGCVVATSSNTNSHWNVVANYDCRNGAQMVWNVQDGPGRMNNCSIAPQDNSMESKISVLDSAFNAGMGIGMRYFEVYAIDLIDPHLDSVLNQVHSRISGSVNSNCHVTNTSFEHIQSPFSMFPNPTNGIFRIKGPINQIEKIKIHNQLGYVIFESRDPKSEEIDISGFPPGMYFLSILNNTEELSSLRIIKI